MVFPSGTWTANQRGNKKSSTIQQCRFGFQKWQIWFPEIADDWTFCQVKCASILFVMFSDFDQTARRPCSSSLQLSVVVPSSWYVLVSRSQFGALHLGLVELVYLVLVQFARALVVFWNSLSQQRLAGCSQLLRGDFASAGWLVGGDMIHTRSKHLPAVLGWMTWNNSSILLVVLRPSYCMTFWQSSMIDHYLSTSLLDLS